LIIVETSKNRLFWVGKRRTEDLSGRDEEKRRKADKGNSIIHNARSQKERGNPRNRNDMRGLNWGRDEAGTERSRPGNGRESKKALKEKIRPSREKRSRKGEKTTLNVSRENKYLP